MGCFNKHGCNFDDDGISKIGYSRPSENKGILE